MFKETGTRGLSYDIDKDPESLAAYIEKCTGDSTVIKNFNKP